MSRLKLSKKLKLAKKAWKSLSNTLHSKVHKLNIPKAIKTALQHLLLTLNSLNHLIKPSRLRRSLTDPRPYATSYYHIQHKNFVAICIDDRFA